MVFSDNFALPIHRPMCIGIAGASGSGKSTMAKIINTSYKGKITTIGFDDYYPDLSHLPLEEREKQDFDNPSILDWPLFMQQVLQLLKYQPIYKPLYNFKTHSRRPETEIVHPSDVILIEGIFAYSQPDLIPYYDYRVGVIADLDECLIRRTLRDIAERGRNPKQIFAQWRSQVKPNYLSKIGPNIKEHANVIIHSKYSENIPEQQKYYCDAILPIIYLIKEKLQYRDLYPSYYTKTSVGSNQFTGVM